MMDDSIIAGVPNITFVILGVLVLVLIIVLIVRKKKTKEKKNDNVSILDVNNPGVPNSSENPEFAYGYEKEQTVVMDPVNPAANPMNVQSQTPDVMNASIPTAPSMNNQLNSAVPNGQSVSLGAMPINNSVPNDMNSVSPVSQPLGGPSVNESNLGAVPPQNNPEAPIPQAPVAPTMPTNNNPGMQPLASNENAPIQPIQDITGVPQSNNNPDFNNQNQ